MFAPALLGLGDISICCTTLLSHVFFERTLLSHVGEGIVKFYGGGILLEYF